MVKESSLDQGLESRLCVQSLFWSILIFLGQCISIESNCSAFFSFITKGFGMEMLS